MLLNSSFWRSTVYFLAEFLHSVLARYSLFSLIFSYNNHYVIIFGYNRVLFGGIFRQKVHGSNAYLAAKFYFKPCTFWRIFSPKSTRLKCWFSCENVFQTVYFLEKNFINSSGTYIRNLPKRLNFRGIQLYIMFAASCTKLKYIYTSKVLCSILMALICETSLKD